MFCDTPDDEAEDEATDPIFDELLSSDSHDAQAARQLAIEEIVGRLIAAFLEESADTSVNPPTTLEHLLTVIPEAYLDLLEGDVYGTAYANVFDRVRSFVDRYHDDPPLDEDDC